MPSPVFDHGEALGKSLLSGWVNEGVLVDWQLKVG